MYFYILICLSLILSLIMSFIFRKMKCHDKILFQFCQIRRDIIALLSEKENILTKNQYMAVRETLRVLNMVIHSYNHIKGTVFNYRKFEKQMKNFRDNTMKIKSILETDDHQITALQNKLRKALFLAFLTYTPFLGSEICCRILLELFKILAKTGIKKLESGARYLVWVMEEKNALSSFDDIQTANC